EDWPDGTWLWTGLKRLGLPVICIDARHAKAVLKMQISKSDRNDAAGIARIMQTGWFKECASRMLTVIRSERWWRAESGDQLRTIFDQLFSSLGEDVELGSANHKTEVFEEAT